MFHEIPHYKVISCGGEIYTPGNSPVKVIAENYKTYLAKNSKALNPATDIVNELLAHCFLTLLNSKTFPYVLLRRFQSH